MRVLARILGAAALVGTIAPPIAYLNGSISLDVMKWWMLAFTIVWFMAAPIADRQTKLEAIVEQAGGEVVP